MIDWSFDYSPSNGQHIFNILEKKMYVTSHTKNLFGIATGWLTMERKEWRRADHFGFIAKPLKNDDDLLNSMSFEWATPGKTGTCWKGALYK